MPDRHDYSGRARFDSRQTSKLALEYPAHQQAFDLGLTNSSSP
jgi:hypothetical protein